MKTGTESSLFALLWLPFMFSLVEAQGGFMVAKRASQPTCYWKYNGMIEFASNDGPCGTNYDSPLSCCSDGDVCMGNNICKGSGGSHTGGSGYYLSGCTDSTLDNTTACTTHCGSNGYPDIVYDTTDKVWACCQVIDFVVNCAKPTSETWSAPAPKALDAMFTAHSSILGATTSVSSTSTSSATTSKSSSATTSGTTAAASSTSTVSPVPADSSSHMGTGAVAGIIVGVVILLAFVGSAAWYMIRNRRRKKEFEAAIASQPSKWSGENQYAPDGILMPRYQELPANKMTGGSWYTPVPIQPVELPAAERPAELGDGRGEGARYG